VIDGGEERDENGFSKSWINDGSESEFPSQCTLSSVLEVDMLPRQWGKREYDRMNALRQHGGLIYGSRES